MSLRPETPESLPLRRGAVAVVVRDARFLVIRRSLSVRAPGALCFPGGGIEQGESEQEALVREIREELGVAIRPLRRVWSYTTPWRVDLAWWLGELASDEALVPNALEVAEVHWLSPEEIVAREDLLTSNRAFFAALAAGEIELG